MNKHQGFEAKPAKPAPFLNKFMNNHQGFEALAGVCPLRGKVLPSTRKKQFRKQEYLVNKGVTEGTPELQKSQSK